MQIISKEGSISTMDPWNGFFFIDETLRNDTSVVLVSPLVGLYSVTITDPNEVETELANGDTNWFALDTTIGVASKQFSNPAVSLLKTCFIVNFYLIAQIHRLVNGATLLIMIHQIANRAKMLKQFNFLYYHHRTI